MVNFMLRSKAIRTARIDDGGNITAVYISQTEAGVCNDCVISAISKYCRGVGIAPKGIKFKRITNKEYKEFKHDK